MHCLEQWTEQRMDGWRKGSLSLWNSGACKQAALSLLRRQNNRTVVYSYALPWPLYAQTYSHRLSQTCTHSMAGKAFTFLHSAAAARGDTFIPFYALCWRASLLPGFACISAILHCLLLSINSYMCLFFLFHDLRFTLHTFSKHFLQPFSDSAGDVSCNILHLPPLLSSCTCELSCHLPQACLHSIMPFSMSGSLFSIIYLFLSYSPVYLGWVVENGRHLPFIYLKIWGSLEGISDGEKKRRRRK